MADTKTHPAEITAVIRSVEGTIDNSLDVDHIPLREIADLLKAGRLTAKEAGRVFRRANDHYIGPDVVTDGELAALRELRLLLTDLINPYSVEQLDKRIAELDARFPDWEHFYHRVGTTVTWHSRPRSPDHPLWHFYPHEPQVLPASSPGCRSRKNSGAL
jgi:hypothetical protein